MIANEDLVNPPEKYHMLETGPISCIIFSYNKYFKDKPRIDIRMWFKGEHDGKYRASKKGITLNPELDSEFIDTYMLFTREILND